MTECEASAIRFTIDHYEPRAVSPELEHSYLNLLYACDVCNRLKGDRVPSAAARAAGIVYFRPDQHIHSDHFEREGLRLKQKSNVGYFTIEALELNRLGLRRLREIRQRLWNCEKAVTEGVTALRNFHLDELPTKIKGQAASAIRRLNEYAKRTGEQIDSLLREHARSPLLDSDPKAADDRLERASKLQKLETLYPGTWRAPRRKKRRTRGK